ncbi:UDP-N-acetylmuramate dehydrogenase [Amnibacterium sp. CER49]|uniref:UDP-N-acetylmuramate dehydrogenase n=1 Tax=Amnibacterium sp. CER49 TaxID=3039161 RepID=UPI00244A7C86|nr:UDP-N-acetylmuramate dehydrogenase [Amnibacterium sp. CER49]MDH2443014.1 UDP-N-acetylmuramate dehydrogenase [Amnibacterium sp. CER49]
MTVETARAIARLDDVIVERDLPLSRFTSWRIGGSVRLVAEPRTGVAAAATVATLARSGEPWIAVGGTSNLLFDSAQHDETVLQIGAQMSEVSIDGRRVVAQAGVSVPALARAVGAAGLTGIEHTVGIPGTLGGLVLMNGGSMRRGIGERVVRVTGVDREGELVQLTQEECEFAYRSSALQHLGILITEVELELELGEPAEIADRMDAIVSSRAARFPLDLPSGGSTFLSSPELYESVGPPGRVIELAGLKGVRRGGAMISERHANFIVNIDGASSDDVLWLIALARRAVHRATGHWLECEVRYVSPAGAVVPAHLAADHRWSQREDDDEGVGLLQRSGYGS